MANATTLQVGAWNALTDAFIAHPNSPTGAVYDLNDGVTWTLVDEQEGLGTALTIDPPNPEVYKVKNSRSIGERLTRRNYSGNRTIRAKLLQLPQTSSAVWDAALRSLLQLCEGISLSQPAALKIQLTTGTAPIYADVLAAHIRTRYKETLFAQLVNDEVEVEFECRPFLRGARQTLSNLIVNPGFEAPAGPGVQVFNDNFATTNAYTTVSGGPPSVSGNVLILPANTQVKFGSPSWGAVNQWQLRFFLSASASCYFYLHYTDASNHLRVDVNPTGLQLNHMVAGTLHTLATATVTVSSSTVYWLVFTQFPSPPGQQCDAQATFYSDSSGSIGSLLASLGPAATFDGVTALSGYPLIQSGSATLNVTVSKLLLFGPGGWAGTGMNGSVAEASLAWEQTTANTYPGGATTSYGAARIDLPPAGTVNAYWENYSGGAPAGTSAMAATTGQTVAASVYVKSSGLSGTAQVLASVREWDVNGNPLRATTLQSVTGNQASWTKLSGTVALGASTVYCSLLLQVSDAVSGASANGTVWFDNTQCWNVTTTGQNSMPYCELRFPQSPAQLLLTGIQGDVETPASLSFGAFQASITSGSSWVLRVGQRQTPLPGFRGVLWPLLPQASMNLGSANYGGCYTTSGAIGPSGSTEVVGLAGSSAIPRTASYVGVYHVQAHFSDSDTNAGCALCTARVVLNEAVPGAQQLSGWNGPFYNAGLTTSAAWAVVDAGQAIIPLTTLGALTDPTTTYDVFYFFMYNNGPNSPTFNSDVEWLLPVDGAYMVATIADNVAPTFTNTWLWVYNDGLLVQQGFPAAWRASYESTIGLAGIPNPAHATAGALGTATSIAPGAAAFLSLHPTNVCNIVRGVEQLVVAWHDTTTNAANLPINLEAQYSPLYLWPF